MQQDAMTILIDQLRADPLARQTISTLINLIDETDEIAAELQTVRKLGQSMQKQQTELLGRYQHAQEENQALRAFIKDHVTDEEALKKIFN